MEVQIGQQIRAILSWKRSYHNSHSLLHLVPGSEPLPNSVTYLKTTCTLQMAEDRPVREDAPAVMALQQAGALLVGKANCHELGLGMSGINAACGTPRNPHRPSCCAGGSSSGSAAIVSAGICAFALGDAFAHGNF